jgi:hypothetical protein
VRDVRDGARIHVRAEVAMSALASNAEVGHLAELHAARWRPELALVPDHPSADVASMNYLDGVLVRPVVSHMGVTVAPAGTPVEVKAAALRKADGASVRRGDIQIRRYAHEWLVERDGEYIVVVYDDGDDGLVWLAERMVPARTVDALITRWCADGLSEAARIPWSRLMDAARVERGDRR